MDGDSHPPHLTTWLSPDSQVNVETLDQAKSHLNSVMILATHEVFFFLATVFIDRILN